MSTGQIPPSPPAPPHTPPYIQDAAGAIRRYLGARRIWQRAGAGYALNDMYSKQVRRDSLRFGIGKRHRTGM